MALGMEFDAPTFGRSELTAKKRGDYLRFHKNWLVSALQRQDFALIPTIVSAIQGRKLSQLLLDEIDNSHLEPTAPLIVKKLKEIRRQLRLKALEIRRQGAFGEIVYHHYNTLLVEYRCVRAEVAGLEEYRYLTVPYQELSLHELIASLEKGQWLIIWIALPALHGLLLLCRDRPPFWQETPDPKRLLDSLAEFGLFLSKTGAHQQRLTRFWDDAAYQLDDLLWKPLRLALSRSTTSFDLNRLTFVTVGGSHLLPLTLSAEGLPISSDRINHFPGLIFYQQYCQRLRYKEYAPLPGPALGLQYYEGNGCYGNSEKGYADQRLFMVRCEVDAICSYWQEVHQLQPLAHYDYLADSHAVVRVHFSCHGGIDPHNPWSTTLNIKPGVWLDAPTILHCRTQPKEIIAAACVAMQTREDPDGDPFGIGAAFLLRNVAALVGATLPISDLWMTVFSLLLHQALGESCQAGSVRTLNQALYIAKLRIASGDWFPDTALRLRRYLPQGLLRRWNEQALVILNDANFLWRKEEAFILLPDRAARRALLEALVDLHNTRQRQALVTDWAKQHQLASLLGGLIKMFVSLYHQQKEALFYEYFAEAEVLADSGFGILVRQGLWESLQRDIAVRRSELLQQGRGLVAANRDAHQECFDNWRGSGLIVLSEQAIERILTERVPPQPDLGILLHGVRVYGQGRALPLA